MRENLAVEELDGLIQELQSARENVSKIEIQNSKLDFVSTGTLLVKIVQCPKLQDLTLGSISRNPGPGDVGLGVDNAGASLIATYMLQNNQIPDLKSLDLSYNKLTSTGAEEIARALRNTKSIKILNLAHNTIEKTGFLANINECPSLESFIFKENYVGVGGATDFADYLRENTSLKQLEISKTWVYGNRNLVNGSQGATQIADALKVNTTLTLDIRSNLIESEGATQIADALKVNSTLRHLDIENDMIGSESAIDSFRCFGWL